MNRLVFQAQLVHEKSLKHFYLISSVRFNYRERVTAWGVFSLSLKGFSEVLYL